MDPFRIKGAMATPKSDADLVQYRETGRIAADVLTLMQMVAVRIRDRHGVELQPEVRLVGFA